MFEFASREAYLFGQLAGKFSIIFNRISFQASIAAIFNLKRALGDTHDEDNMKNLCKMRTTRTLATRMKNVLRDPEVDV